MKAYEIIGKAHRTSLIKAETIGQAIADFQRENPGYSVETAFAEDGSECGAICGYCETCRKPLFDEDDYQVADEDGDVYLCSEHKLTPEQIDQINADAAADEEIDA